MLKKNRVLIPDVAWCEFGEEVCCPFCRCEKYSQHAYEEFRWVTISIVRCGNCGHLYANPRPTKESVVKHYSESYLQHKNVMLPKNREDIFAPDSLWAKKLERYRYYLSLIPKPRSPDTRILDIGCSWGGFLAAAEETFETQNLFGLDISTQAIEFVTGQMGYDGYTGNIIDFAEDNANRFDYIFSSHSLEHSLEPKEDLQAILKLLRAGGIFFLTLPNHGSFLVQEMGAYSPAVRGGNHYQFFTQEYLAKRLREAGFVILEQFTSSFLSPYTDTIHQTLQERNKHFAANEAITAEDIDVSGQGEFLYFVLSKQQAEE